MGIVVFERGPHRAVSEQANQGMVFNIQRYSIQDGPGIRTTVFLKGCPLSCLWCSNPESQKSGPELMFRPTLCDGCGKCLSACPVSAMQVWEGKLRIDRARCNGCMFCISACLRNALDIAGKLTTVDQVITEVQKDQPFYGTSGGGVTISGGEPLFQPEFTVRILEESHLIGIHTCLETAGYSSRKVIEMVLPHTDLFYYDLKHMNNEAHQKLTGVPVEPILDNLRFIDAAKKEIVIRVPLIPGRNDSEENITETARFSASLKSVSRIDILPYHRFGEGKYAGLGREYPLTGVASPSEEALAHTLETVGRFGVPAHIEG